MRKQAPTIQLLVFILLIGLTIYGVKLSSIRWDLTLDQRYTINETTKEALKKIKQPLLLLHIT